MYNKPPELQCYQFHVDVTRDKSWGFCLLLGFCGQHEEGCLCVSRTEVLQPLLITNISGFAYVTKEQRDEILSELEIKALQEIVWVLRHTFRSRMQSVPLEII